MNSCMKLKLRFVDLEVALYFGKYRLCNAVEVMNLVSDRLSMLHVNKCTKVFFILRECFSEKFVMHEQFELKHEFLSFLL